jgi:hypothetical protein
VFIVDRVRLMDWPGAGIRRAFVEAADLHPSLSWLDPHGFVRRPHLRCKPSMYRGSPGQWHPLGSGPFTPENAWAAAERLLRVAVLVEAAG